MTDVSRPNGAGPQEPERRGFLQVLAGVFGVLAAAAAGIPIIGYFVGPIARPRPDGWVSLGAIESFPIAQTRLVDFDNPTRRPWDGTSGRGAAYVRRLDQSNFRVFAINCTHLGCPVSWFPQSGLFLCPCHGGVYYEDGARAAGPPPRGLYEYDKRVRNGQLEILAGHLPVLQDPIGAVS